MNREQNMAGESPQMDMELEQALKHFKSSVDAWSYAVSTDAAGSRPRTAAKLAVRHSWRMAAGWALGCLLAAGSLTVAGHEICLLYTSPSHPLAQESSERMGHGTGMQWPAYAQRSCALT